MKRSIVLQVVFWVCLAAACGRNNEPAPAPPPAAAPAAKEAESHADASVVRVDETMLRDLRVTTAAVESRKGGEDALLLGELAVDQGAYAEVGVPVSARVTRLLAAPGDSVRQGQVLVELQSPDLGRARAAYGSAVSRLKLAEGVLTRKRDLAAEKIAPMREVQEAESAVAEARAEVRGLASQLTSLGVALPTEGDTESASGPDFGLRTPIAGSVISRAATLGQMLDPATPAYRIANLSRLWLTVHAFERDAVRITKGSSVRLAFPALPGQSFTGTVSLIGGEVSAESRTVPIRIDVANRGNLLRPGMSASAQVPVGKTQTDILTVPVTAVQRVRNEWCVFIPKSDREFEIRKIGRGREIGGEVEVLSGLTKGERIVVEGAFLLKSQAEKGEAGHGHGGQP